MLPTKATTINIKIDKDFSLWEVGGKFKTIKLSLCYPLPIQSGKLLPVQRSFPEKSDSEGQGQRPVTSEIYSILTSFDSIDSTHDP